MPTNLLIEANSIRAICNNFSVTNIFARVHDATNVMCYMFQYAPEMTMNGGAMHA